MEFFEEMCVLEYLVYLKKISIQLSQFRYIISYNMALNISKAIDNKTVNHGPSQQLRKQFNITVNEPTQSHFSVEGVQTYSAEQIKAIKLRQDRVAAQRQGQYIKVKNYAVDQNIEYQGTVAPTNATDNAVTATLKPKSNKTKLEPAKPEVVKSAERPKTAVVKPSIKNELGRANQKTVKLTKEQEKLRRMQEKLSELTKQYRVHFGEDLKVMKKGKEKVKIQEATKNDEEGKDEVGNKDEQNDEEFEQFEDQEGEQALPQMATKNIQASKSKKADGNRSKMTKPDQDDSFEEVQWEGTHSQPSQSRLRQSTHSYSERLGNAVHLLFD